MTDERIRIETTLAYNQALREILGVVIDAGKLAIEKDWDAIDALSYVATAINVKIKGLGEQG